MGKYDNMTIEEFTNEFDKKIQKIKEIIDQKYFDGYVDGVNNTAKDFQLESKKTYSEGLNVAWACARKIANREDEMREIFHDIAPAEIFIKYSAPEVIQKINNYEKKQKCQTCDKTRDPIFYGCCNGTCVYNNEIKIGDEVTNSIGTKMIVVEIEEDLYKGLADDRFMYGTLNSAKKTGRSFPQIVEILKQIGDKEE